MNHLTLTETEFFQQLYNNECRTLPAAYNSFITRVVELWHDVQDLKHAAVALMYAEIELQFHSMQDNEAGIYVRKAHAFIKKMQKILSTSTNIPVPPLTSISDTQESTPALQWTGNAIDLVELIYALYATGCINDGKTALKELAPVLYSFFGVNSKDCYRFYTDIKRRKNDSRTYFLERMQDKLNEKMRRDDELERMRR